jgi:cell division protease FtsH
MVKEFGMSERVGQVYFARRQQPVFLGQSAESGGEYSDETARVIDEEVRRIVDDQYAVAVGILEKHRQLLEKTAIRLLKDEVIEGEALDHLAAAVRSKACEADTPDAESKCDEAA